MVCSVIRIQAVTAQVGYLDTSFYNGMGANVKCTAGLVLPDSSVIVTGKFSYIHQTPVNCIAKLFPNGKVDNSFNSGTGANDYVNVIVRQPDGKLIIAGEFTTYNGSTVNRIARLNPNGTRDLSFNTGSGINGPVYALYLQDDGKILIGGSFTQFNGTAAKNIVRLNANGSIDNGFVTGTGCNNSVFSIDQQSNGQIILGGDFTSYNNIAAGKILRINYDGTLDTGFQLDGTGANSLVTATVFLPGGKILVAGTFNYFNGHTAGRVICLNYDGSEDLSFNVGAGFNTTVQEMTLQPDGKVLLCGDFTFFNGVSYNRIIRLHANGTIDAGFDAGTGANNRCNALFLDQAGNIYTGGFFTAFNNYTRLRFARLKADGSVDQTFFTESKLNGSVLAAVFQTGSRPVVAGSFTAYNGTATGRIARLDPQGNLDYSFNNGGAGANGIIRSICMLPGDKLLIGGNFTTYNGITANCIALLNADGTLDNTFLSGTGFNNSVNCIVTDSSGKIYVAGSFTTYDNAAANRIVRLNANGTRDNSFTGTGFNNVVNKIAVQADGKLVCGGNFTNYSGTARNRVVRLNNNGTLDNTFTIGVGANGIVNTIAIQPDGKILIGGAFTKYNNINKLRIARLNTDGTPDATLVLSVNNNNVFSITATTNGILLGGSFTKVNNVTKNRIAFVTGSGVISNVFYTGNGASGNVNVIAFELNERKALVGGDFETFQNKLSNKLALVEYTGIKLNNSNNFPCPGVDVIQDFVKAATFNSGNTFTVELSNHSGEFDSTTSVIGSGNVNTSGPGSITLSLPANVVAGNSYKIRIIASNPADTSRIAGPVTVTIPPKPMVSYTGPTAFCAGQNIMLYAPGGMSNYQWSNGTNTGSTQAGTTGDYSFVATDNNNCVLKSDTVQITVFAAPDSAVNISVASLCNGGSLKLSAQPNFSYAWSNGASTSNITVNQTGTYTVTVTDTNGCKSDSVVYADMSSYFTPLVYAEGPTSFCFDTNVTIKASLSGFNYHWNNNAATQGIVVNSSGTYTVSISDGNCTMAASLPVIVWAEPDKHISTSGSDTFCAGGILTLQAAPGMQYGWSNGETTQSITISSPGTYYTTLVDQTTGCSTTSETLQITGTACATGIGDVSANTAMSIYPNPTTDYLVISNSVTPIEKCVVYDIAGKEMLSVEPAAYSTQVSIDVTTLAEGAYILKANNQSYRFIKRH